MHLHRAHQVHPQKLKHACLMHENQPHAVLLYQAIKHFGCVDFQWIGTNLCFESERKSYGFGRQ